MIIHCKTFIYTVYKSINKSSSRVDCRERWEANVDGEIIRSEEKSGEKQPVLLRAQWRRISLLRSLSASDDGAPASLLHWRSDPPSSRCSSQCVCVLARARVCAEREAKVQRFCLIWLVLSAFEVPVRKTWCVVHISAPWTSPSELARPSSPDARDLSRVLNSRQAEKRTGGLCRVGRSSAHKVSFLM